MSLVRLALRVAAGLTLVLALAACAGGTASPGSTVGSGAGTVVEVKALEYKFEPAAITVPAGMFQCMRA